MIDVHTVNKKKKKREFFAEILCRRKLWKKKMIDVHIINTHTQKKNKKTKNKKQRNWDFCRDSLQWIYVYS